MKHRNLLALLALAVIACEKPAPPPADTATPAPPPAPAAEPVPTVTAPAEFKVRMETSKGPVVIALHRDWAPNGVDRFFQLVDASYFDDVRFFRVVPGFVVQFGMHGDPATNARWQGRTIQDEPVKGSNTRGIVTFAKSSLPNSRSTQIFISLRDNSFLDADGFSPIGEVIEGMSVIDALYSGYGDGMDQGAIAAQGNAYLKREFPKLDFIRTARVLK